MLTPRIDETLFNPKIQECMNTEKYIHNFSGKDNSETSLKYLKLAHAITTKHMDIRNYSRWVSDELRLNSRRGNCTEISRYSYSNFLYLLDEVGKPELKDYVRLALGDVSEEKGSGKHMWLEVYQNNKWEPYESINVDLDSSQIIKPESIDSLIPTERVVSLKNWKYTKTNDFQVSKTGEVDRNTYYLSGLKTEGLLFEYILSKL